MLVASLYHVFRTQEIYVYPDKNGSRRGHYIKPLHRNVAQACRKDDKLYELIALSDVIRIGGKSDKEKAILELRKRILNN